MSTEDQDSEIEDRKPKRFPWLSIAVTILAVAAATFVNVGADWLNESVNLNPGVPNVARLIMFMIIWLTWLIWFAFYSSSSRWQRLLVAAGWFLIPFVFFGLLQPIFDGDLQIVGWKYRFARTAAANVEVRPIENGGNETVRLEVSKLDFPQFLGKNRDATVAGVQLAADWNTDPPEVVWKQPIGEGWSGFAIVGDLAFTQEQLLDQECVSCYRVDSGELVWQHRGQRRHEDISAMGRVGPRATPTVFDAQVYAMGATGVLDCLDAASGKPLWSVDVPAAVGIELVQQVNSNGLAYTQENSTLSWGRSASPLIFEDLVIVPGGGPQDAKPGSAVTMLAFDRETGEERWRGGERNISYGSPSLTHVLGGPQIVLVAENTIVGHDPNTGQELWSHPWPGNSNGDANCSQVTTVQELDDKTQLLLSKGYGAGGELIEVGPYDGELVTTTVAKSSRVLKTKLTNPVLLDGYAYSLSDGFLECTRLPSLDRQWKKRGRFGNGQILLVGDKLLVHSESGELYLVDATPEGYRELGSFPTIKGVCWNTLALSGDRLLVRSELEAAMIKLPLAKSN